MHSTILIERHYCRITNSCVHPSFSISSLHTYQKPVKMVIADSTKHDYIFSNEGCTQGDVTAMALYTLGIRPLIDNLGEVVDHEKCKQSWYADDSSAGGQLTEMKTWWDQLYTVGPKYGYYPQESKTILIVKERFQAKAKAIFGKSGIKISTRGERHMGAVITSERFKDGYVSKKVEKWDQDIEQLSNIAKDEPHAVCPTCLYNRHDKQMSNLPAA